MARVEANYMIVVVDYFIEWIKVVPMAMITLVKVISFVVMNIIYRYKVSNKITIDNGTQLESLKFMYFCTHYGITESF